MGQLYKMGIFSQILFVLFVSSYFFDPNIMIYGNTIIIIINIAIFSAYSIKLNNYITNYFYETFHNYQVVRNSIIADGTIIGLSLATFILYFFNISYGLIFFMIINSLFILWMFFNYNIFDNIKD